jgi:hypothetical protein
LVLFIGCGPISSSRGYGSVCATALCRKRCARSPVILRLVAFRPPADTAALCDDRAVVEELTRRVLAGAGHG